MLFTPHGFSQFAHQIGQDTSLGGRWLGYAVLGLLSCLLLIGVLTMLVATLLLLPLLPAAAPIGYLTSRLCRRLTDR